MANTQKLCGANVFKNRVLENADRSFHDVLKIQGNEFS